MSTICAHPPDVKYSYTRKLLVDGLTYRGERFKALPHIIRHGFFKEKLTDFKSLLAFVLDWLKEKHNGFGGKFVSNWKRASSTIRRLVEGHLKWASDRNNLDEYVQRQLDGVVQPVIDMVIEVFSSKNKIRTSSLEKLEAIVRKVLQYVYECGSSGVVALPKVVFMTAGAFDGSRNGLCHYLNIKKALEELGILKDTGERAYKGGPCKKYHVDFGGFVKLAPENEFVDRKNKGKRLISSLDKFSSEIMGTDVEISGDEVTEFAKVFEAKLREYSSNYFIKILPLKRTGSSWAYYVRGAAICKLHGFDVSRFVEAQFYYFHQWQDEAPNIKYVTSIASEWSSIGRYHDYCKRFRREIGTLRGADNIEAVTARAGNKPAVRSERAMVQQGNLIFERVRRTFDLTEIEALKFYGNPLRPVLPIEFLKTQAKWLELLLEEAWGEIVNNKFFSTDTGREVLA